MGENSLDFRHIIKAFVPGIIALVCFISLLDLVAYLFTDYNIQNLFTELAAKNKTLSVAILLPTALFTGIMLNTVCFVAFQYSWVARIVLGKNPVLNSLESFKIKTHKMLSSHFYDNLNLSNHNVKKEEFEKLFDYESFLLHRQSVSNLLYLKRGYWYYLEFQLNSILTMIIMIITLGVNLIFRKDLGINWYQSLIIFLVSFSLCFLISWLFLKAIRQNYVTDLRNNISYYLGAFHKGKSKL